MWFLANTQYELLIHVPQIWKWFFYTGSRSCYARCLINSPLFTNPQKWRTLLFLLIVTVEELTYNCGGASEAVNFLIQRASLHSKWEGLAYKRYIFRSSTSKTKQHPSSTSHTAAKHSRIHKGRFHFFKIFHRMAHREHVSAFLTSFRVIFAALCCLIICLQKPAESSPVSSKLVAGGIVSNSFPYFLVYWSFNDAYYFSERGLVQQTNRDSQVMSHGTCDT